MKTKEIKFTSLFILVLVSVLLGVGIIMANENEQQEKKIFMVADAEESTVTVTGAGEFSLRIKSNPTTGYSWAVQKITDEGLVKFKRIKTEEPADRDPSQKPLLGASTYELITFEALNPGKTEIQLNYRRPWEKDVAPAKTHKVIVTIEF